MTNRQKDFHGVEDSFEPFQQTSANKNVWIAIVVIILVTIIAMLGVYYEIW